MKRGKGSLLLCAVAAVSLAFMASSTVPACYSAVPNDGLVDACVSLLGPPPDAGAGAVGPGEACGASAGTLPSSGNCHVPWVDGGESCTPSCTPCSVDPDAGCGAPRCLPMTNNKSPIYNFRMEALHVILPANLAGSELQNLAVTGGMTLSAPSCGYEPVGSNPAIGGFNWLLSLNVSTHTITTGGALPVADPYGTGYPFLNETYGDAGIHVAPVCFDAGISEKNATGEITFSSAPGTDVLNVPIFLGSTAQDLAEPTILPLHGAEFYDVTISEDGNCIGDINQGWYAYAAGCSDNFLGTCPKWYTAGAVGGYLTITETNKVQVRDANASLCALLVYGAVGIATCKSTDDHSGDYCSLTQKPGGCNDSFWFAATFAANAVKIADGGSPACK
jgi:hypothetical protein